MEDELQEVRDNFYVGNYAKALDLCQNTITSSDFAQLERDAMFARCCLSLGQLDKMRSFAASDNPGQKATAYLTLMTKSKTEQQRITAKDQLIAMAKETQDMTCSLLAAIALCLDGFYNDAVLMAKAHPTVEMQALCVYICLMCNQVGMAEKVLAEAASTNDDAGAFKLASAAVKIAIGEPEEAYLTYSDLGTQYPAGEGGEGALGSVLLLNGKGVANMARGMFAEALEDLQRAHGMAPNDADVLVNMCCCLNNLGKQDEFQQYYSKLEQAAPTHPYVAKSQSIKTVFSTFKASMAAAS